MLSLKKFEEKSSLAKSETSEIFMRTWVLVGEGALMEEKSQQSGQNCILRDLITNLYFTVSKTQSDNFRYQGVCMCKAWCIQVWVSFSFHWLLFLNLVGIHAMQNKLKNTENQYTIDALA